ncbi:MAG: STAS domain-containing protein [Halioglobus sp.]
MSNTEAQQAKNHSAASAFADTPAIPVQVSRGTVVASIQVDLNEQVVARLQEDLLQRIHDSNSTGVILDLSALETLDLEEFMALRRIISVSRIMGAESILVGLKPGVVSSLMEVGADVEGLHAAIDLDAAYSELEPHTQADSIPIQDCDSVEEMAFSVEQPIQPDPGTKGSDDGH